MMAGLSKSNAVPDLSRNRTPSPSNRMQIARSARPATSGPDGAGAFPEGRRVGQFQPEWFSGLLADCQRPEKLVLPHLEALSGVEVEILGGESQGKLVRSLNGLLLTRDLHSHTGGRKGQRYGEADATMRGNQGNQSLARRWEQAADRPKEKLSNIRAGSDPTTWTCRARSEDKTRRREIHLRGRRYNAAKDLNPSTPEHMGKQ